MYKWKKGDGKTMAVLVVVCIIAFIWGWLFQRLDFKMEQANSKRFKASGSC